MTINSESASTKPDVRFWNKKRVVAVVFAFIIVGILCLRALAFCYHLRNALQLFAPNLENLEAKGLIEQSLDVPRIYPDYADVVVPPNVAPMNFKIEEGGKDYLTRFSNGKGFSFVVSGQATDIKLRDWRNLLYGGDKTITAEIFVRSQQKVWKAFAPVKIKVAKEPIDRWLYYRLIEPGYEYFNRVVLAERDLESFNERVWFDARRVSERMCVNCHAFQDHKADNFLFHTRRVSAGTVLCWKGMCDKRAPGVFVDPPLGAAYPAWNPKAPLIAFSLNSTFQMFHATSPDRVEVLDAASDLILFNVENGDSAPICLTDDLFETFPTWSPEGDALYYCVAKSPYSLRQSESVDVAVDASDFFGNSSSTELDRRRIEAVDVYSNFHYNLARRSYDLQTRTFGEPETLVDAEVLDKSVAHPRVSPDGKTLVYTLSKYGTFPIWRRDADLWSLDLATGETHALDELNSADSESWHEWDSSGRWLFFSSRRDDGSYTRVYVAHFSAEGRWSKPFLLPQRDPQENLDRMKSYNLPTPTSNRISFPLDMLIRVARRPC